jgi:glycosyltransferase involved in cell wall biosynthesis
VTLNYSVVIPAYNAAATIGQSIESILAQTIPAHEIIVVDDGSSDGTAAIARGLPGPIAIVSQDNRGPGAATTAGFARATAPFVATLDADDLWLPHKIARQAACFAADPGLAGVFALARLFLDGEPAAAEGNGTVRRLWTRTTLLFRHEAAREVGDFIDHPGKLGEVIDWLARSRDLGQRHALVEEVLALRRVRPGSLSYGRDAEGSRGYLTAIHAALERKKRMRVEAKTGPRCDD